MTISSVIPKGTVRIGLVGYGYWGPNLLRNFLRHGGFTVVGVVDGSEPARDRARRDSPGTATFPSLESLLESVEGVDAMVIATPPATHAGLALTCLERGLHVLIEKPMALSVTECDRILAAASRYKRKVMVDHTFVYNPAVVRMQQEVAKGNLGRLLYYDSSRVNLGGFQKGTSTLWDLAPHDLSILDFLLKGRVPTWISAVGMNHFTADAANLCHVELKYGDEFLAHLHLNWVAPVKIRTVLLGGEDKMIIYDENEAVEKLKIYDRGLAADQQSSARYSYRTGDMVAPQLPQKEALSQMIAALHDYLVKDIIPPSDGEAGRRIVAILEQADKSMLANGPLEHRKVA